MNQPIDMNTPRAQRNGIKLPKILGTGSSPLGGRESSVLSRNSGGLQSSLLSRPAGGTRNLKDKFSVDMTSPQNNDYLSRISQLSSQMDSEAVTINKALRSGRPPVGRNNLLPKLNHSVVVNTEGDISPSLSPRTSKARIQYSKSPARGGAQYHSNSPMKHVRS